MSNQRRLKSLRALETLQRKSLDDERRQLTQSLAEEGQVKTHIKEMNEQLVANHEHMTSDKAPPLDDMFAWDGYRQWEVATKGEIERAGEFLKEIEQRSEYIRSQVKEAQKALAQTESFIEAILEEERRAEEEAQQVHLDELSQIMGYRKLKKSKL